MENNQKQPTIIEKDISDTVLNRIKEMQNSGQLIMPTQYNVGNALKSAYLKLAEKDDLLKCEKNSIAQSLLDMVIQGLTPAKNQCYFIKYGDKLHMSRSYFGDVTVCKHTGTIENEPFAICIYKGDKIEIGFDDLGRKIVLEHETKFENLDNEIIGAYAVVEYKNGKKIYEIMTMNEIKKSWKMSNTIKAGKKSQIQEDFAQEACKRTVIRRLVKMIFNTSIDTNAVIESYTRTTEEEQVARDNVINAEVEIQDVEEKQQVIEEKAGKKEMPKKQTTPPAEEQHIPTDDEIEEIYQKGDGFNFGD